MPFIEVKRWEATSDHPKSDRAEGGALCDRR